MSLIIAIEPDREQAAQLKDLVRRHTEAELILADNTERAIGVIEQRVPDLVLIPPFLSPEDDEALTAALRETKAAAHVQTLTIPLLGPPQTKAHVAGGVLSRLLRDQPRQVSPDTCDPKIFADQITEYLRRVSKDRGLDPGANGNGSSGSGVRKAKGSGATEAAVEKPRPVPEKKTSPVPTPKPARPVEVPVANVSPLEAPLSGVAFDASAPAENKGQPITQPPFVTPAVETEETEGLEQGLTALMDKLSAEGWGETPSPVAAPQPPSANQWAELKEIESLEYAMPSNVPHDEAKASEVSLPEPAPEEPTQAASPAPAEPPAQESASEWGDLMESLKKDLGR